MNIKNSNRHFEKLSSFYKSISQDGNINKIEKDLLKSYILNFYEAVFAENKEINEVSAAPVKLEAKPTAQPIETKVAAKIPVPATPVVAVSEPAVQTAVAEAIPAVEVKEDKIEQIAELKNGAFTAEVIELFNIERGNEISDKLAVTPIKDIGKSMSINEKIFTVKELFNGDQSNFDTTMKNMNELTSFDDAKKYLVEHVIESNDWLEPSKAKKVKTFLMRVQRKYV